MMETKSIAKMVKIVQKYVYLQQLGAKHKVWRSFNRIIIIYDQQLDILSFSSCTIVCLVW